MSSTRGARDREDHDGLLFVAVIVMEGYCGSMGGIHRDLYVLWKRDRLVVEQGNENHRFLDFFYDLG